MRDKKRVLMAELSQEQTSKRRRKARRSTNKAAEEKKTAEEGVFMYLAAFKKIKVISLFPQLCVFQFGKKYIFL